MRQQPATAIRVNRLPRVSMFGHIFGSHVERIGWLRTLVGTLPMLLAIPWLIMIHTMLVVVFYQWLVRPLLGAPRVLLSDYVIIDRHRIRELTWLDRFACMFCSYANGLLTMSNQELDYAAKQAGPMTAWKRSALAVLGVAYLPIYLVYEAHFQVVYNLLASPLLGMHRVSFVEAAAVLNGQGFAAPRQGIFKAWILLMKNVSLRFAMGLEQIESSWCPLRHFETRNGVVYPEHHEKFFGPDDLERMREVLRAEGTVSPRKPRY